MAQVPVNEHNKLLQCDIQATAGHAQVIRNCALIIWDEFPMVNKAVPMAVNDLCQTIFGRYRPF